MLLLYFLLFYIYYPNKRHAKKVLCASAHSHSHLSYYTYLYINMFVINLFHRACQKYDRDMTHDKRHSRAHI